MVGLDFVQDMLDDASGREDERVPSVMERSAPMEWVAGDALRLPFDDASFGAATMGYGLRNVTDIPLALSELHRVRPGICLIHIWCGSFVASSLAEACKL